MSADSLAKNLVSFFKTARHLSGSVLDAVENHKIHTEVWKIGDPDIPIVKQLSNGRSGLELPE